MSEAPGFFAKLLSRTRGRAVDTGRSAGLQRTCAQVPPAFGGKLRLLLARLNNDAADVHREKLRSSILATMADAAEIVAWPETLQIEIETEPVDDSVLRTAQTALEQNRCGLLISGEIVDGRILRLTLTGATSGDRSADGRSELLRVPADRVGDLGALLVARLVLAYGSVARMSDSAVVPLLSAIADHLQPRDWEGFDADPRGELFLALARLHREMGDRTGSMEHLGRAVVGCRAALTEYPRERTPFQWALIHNMLGNILVALANHENGAVLLEQAFAAYLEAEKEWTRERLPLSWAAIQSNIATVLLRIAQTEGDNERLALSIIKYRMALEELTQKRAPELWAMTQLNLGNALSTLAQRMVNPAWPEMALRAYHDALQQWTRERAPLQWATIQHNIGMAYSMLACYQIEADPPEGGREHLDQAAAAYREALQVRTRESEPLDWAMTQYNLAITCAELGRLERNAERLREAAAAYRCALQEWDSANFPQQKAARKGLDDVLVRLGEMEGNVDA